MSCGKRSWGLGVVREAPHRDASENLEVKACNSLRFACYSPHAYVIYTRFLNPPPFSIFGTFFYNSFINNL